MMFPASYIQGKTKVRCNIQFGIAPYIKQIILYDITNTPYIFKIDESTSSQVKNQCDGYFQGWLTKYDEVINCYCRSLFVGHCTHEQLMEHYYEFTKYLKLDSSFLLHLGIDGRGVNNPFQQKLLMSRMERKIPVFSTWELVVFTKFIMHTKQC